MTDIPLRPPAPERPVRLARGAVAALFFSNGAIYSNLVPRYPEIKDALALSDSAYGLSIAVMPLGSLLSGFVAGALIRRVGSGRLASLGMIGLAVGALGVAAAPAPWLFAAALFVVGLLDSVADIAQNSHGLRVQRSYGRSIINSFHAIWSLGAVTGGLMAAGAVALGLPLTVHIGVVAVVFSLVCLGAWRLTLPGSDEPAQPEGDGAASTFADKGENAGIGDAAATAEAGSLTGDPGGKRGGSNARGRRSGPLVPARLLPVIAALSLIAIANSIVEDAGSTWATLYMSVQFDTPEAIAVMGYIAVIGSQFVGRLTGDRLVDRFGQRAVARFGGLLLTVGMSVALLAPTVPTTLVGFAAAGFGIATLIPSVMNAADDLPGLRPGTGLTIVSWLMRVGFLLSPPVVGALSDHYGLRLGLGVTVVAGVVIVALAGSLHGRRDTSSH
ncbi:MAG: MFS transporter [Propionibacteriaceae bacterium]|jgi:MFS family permease|nr:MFS transporter [Propionibacteriaceae bacterium]